MGQEDPLEKEMATHSGILAWRILWTEEPGRSPQSLKESDMTEQLHFTSLHKVLLPQQSSPPEVSLNPLIYGSRFFFFPSIPAIYTQNLQLLCEGNVSSNLSHRKNDHCL